MKVIDLLNKIANKENLPQRIKYEDKVYLYYKAYAGYYEKGYSGIYNKNFLSFRNEQWHSVLNSEVEIIEEDKEIEEISEGDIQSHYFTGADEIIARKLNGLIREVNKLKKEGK